MNEENKTAAVAGTDAAQTVTAPAVAEIPADSKQPHKGSNSGSKPKKLPALLIKRIAKVKELVATQDPKDAADLLRDLTRFGIDYRVAEEHPTSATESRPYCYAQSLKTGGGIWVYESELTITLVNTDEDADTEDTSVHAIGSSRKDPETARTAAWLQSLTIFLAQRFGALYLLKGTTDEAPSAPQQNSPQERKTAPQNGQQDGVRPLSDAQINRLYKKAEAAGLTAEDARAHAREKYGKENVALLTREEYDEICAFYDKQRQTGGR